MRLCVVVFTGCLLASAAFGNIYGFQNGGGLGGWAEFTDEGGGNLRIDLINIGTGSITSNPQVLTGLFFNYTGGALTNPAAFKPTGEETWTDNSAATTLLDLGPFWAYRSNLTTIGGETVNFGFGASGFGGVFGAGDAISGSSSPGGVDYGVVNDGNAMAGFLPAANYTGCGSNTGLCNNDPFVTFARFTLNYSGTFDFSKLSTIVFQYGSSLNESRACVGGGCLNEIPEPAQFLSLLLVGAPLVWYYRRRRAAQA